MCYYYLCIVDHVDSLEDDVPGVLPEEGEDVCHRGLVRKTSESDAVLAGPGGDELLGHEG